MQIPKDRSGTKEPSESRAERDIFDDYIKGHGLPALLVLILLTGIFIFRDYLLFEHLYLFKDIGSDSLNISYPQLIHISEYLRIEGIPTWSFNQGMGQDIFPFTFASPFDSLLYAMGKDHLAYGIVYVEFLKIILGGVFFYLYLRTLSLSTYVSIAGGLLFSFSGFMILGGGWYLFSSKAVNGALLLLAFERLFKKNSWLLFPIAIALISSLQPFDLYLYGTFLIIYAVFRHIDENGIQMKSLATLFLKMAGFGLLGIGMSSVFVFGKVIQILQSPRVGGDASYINVLSSLPPFRFAEPIEYLTSLMRLFSNDLLGTGSMFMGWRNYLEAPIFYCGLLTLLLVPQVFYFSDRKHKALYAGISAIFVLPIIFPFLRHALWLFSGDYYRSFSFFVVLLLLFMGLHALDHIYRKGKLNTGLLISTFIILAGALHYPYFPEAKHPLVNTDLKNLVTLFLAAYVILIYLLKFKKTRLIIQTLLLILVCIELAYISSITANQRSMVTAEEFNQKTGYNDYTNEAISYINQKDKGFYRIEKDYSSGPAVHTSINDGKVQGYKGTSSYDPFNQKYYINFLQETGIINGEAENQTRWAPGLRNRFLFQSLASVKYHLSKRRDTLAAKFGYTHLRDFGNVKVLINNFYLPLGFTYDSYITKEDLAGLPGYKKEIALLNAFVIENSKSGQFRGFTRFNINTIPDDFSYKQYGAIINNRKKDALQISAHSHKNIKGTIVLKEKKLLFFSIPFDKGWYALVDGEKRVPELINIGFMGLIIEKGQHTVELRYRPPYLMTGAMSSIAFIIIYIILVRSRSHKSLSLII